MRARHNLSGMRFGRLTVIQFSGLSASRKTLWRCNCACGAERVVQGSDLVAGRTQSCGCLLYESRYRVRVARPFYRPFKPNPGNSRHGHNRAGERSITYTTWVGMRTRCTNPRAENYKRYGGRGIRVCRRWASFENFLADMGERPSASHSIDRINVQGNYEPANCRWATAAEQLKNRRATQTT